MAIELDHTAKLSIDLELRNLNADFCFYLDHADTERLVDLFTTDAIYTHGDRKSVGRDAISDLFNNRNSAQTRTSRHIQSGLRIDITSEATATGHSVCLTFAADSAVPVNDARPHLVADFVDTYQYCPDGRWRFNSRHIERIFTDPENHGPIGSNS